MTHLTILREIRSDLHSILEFQNYEPTEYGVTVNYMLGPLQMHYMATWLELAEELKKQSWVSRIDPMAHMVWVTYDTCTDESIHGEQCITVEPVSEGLDEYAKTFSDHQWKEMLVGLELSKTLDRLVKNAWGAVTAA